MPKNKSFRQQSSYLAPLADNEELMQFTRSLIKEKDSLNKTLHNLNEECDLMLSLLCSTSNDERVDLLNEFSPVGIVRRKTSIFDSENLQNFIAARNLNIIVKFLGIKARESSKGEIIVEFIPPDNYIPQSPAFITFNEDDGSLKLKTKLLPSAVPVSKLESHYLLGETFDISAFVFIIQKFVWAFWMRDKDIQQVKNAPFMNDSIVYHNTSRTLVTFTINLSNRYKIEMCLKYEPLFMIPYDVTYSEFQDLRLTPDMKLRLGELRRNLLVHPLGVVLKDLFSPDSDRSGSSSKVSDVSEDTVVFEMFK